MKKFLRLQGEKVMLIHHMPFDKKNGLGKTVAELEQEGVLVDEIPEKPDVNEGEVALPYYTQEKGFHYRIKKQHGKK